MDFYAGWATAEYDLSLVEIYDNLFLVLFTMKIININIGVLLVFQEKKFLHYFSKNDLFWSFIAVNWAMCLGKEKS